MRAVLVLGGDPPTTDERRHLATADVVVATDGGAATLLREGLLPDRIIGDMDSLAPELEQYAIAEEVPMDRHPAAKAETDGELALRWVLDQGPRELLLLGGHGGRSAMFLTHLTLLRRAAEANVRATMIGHGETLRVLLAGEEHGAGPPGLLNMIALEPAVVVLDGLRYSGRIALPAWGGKGVSNPIKTPLGRVQVEEGVVLVIEERR